MNLTEGTHKEKTRRAKKMMLYFGIASLVMSFAGLTSAYIISSKREDWLTDFQLPQAFTISTLLILLSSLTMYVAFKALNQQKRSMTTSMLVATFVLGLLFVFFQFKGYSEMISSGYYLTGEASNVTMSYIYVISFLHIAHVIAGMISLIVVIYNHFKQKYNHKEYLGFELAMIFWHFVDILWIYLFLFFSFYR